jgi:hypothetical protein
MTDKQRIAKFIEAVEKLERNRFYPECLVHQLRVDLPPDMRTFSLDFDEDALKSFLVTFRRFFLQNDDCYVDGVYKSLHREFRHTKTERWIRLSEKRMRAARTEGRPEFRLTVNGVIQQPERLFLWWMSGETGMFHEDQQKAFRWQGLTEHDGIRDAAKAIVLHFINKTTRELVHLKQVIQ